jgi:acyl-CoA thioesterase-1
MAPRALEPIAVKLDARDLTERDLTERDMAERGALIVPCPRVSRAPAVFSSVEGRVAREVGVGPARVLVSWARGVAVSAPDGLPRAYRIETSASSRNGSDGEWRLELSMHDNAALARVHEIEFDGQTWVRMMIDEVAGEAPARVARFDIHDASDGTEDSWLVLGDRLAESAFALEGNEGSTFADVVHERYPGYFPVVVNEGRTGEAVAQTLARLPMLLESHTHARHALLVYGDAHEGDAERFASLVRALIDAGRVPVIVQLPGAELARQIEAQHDLVPGPDLREVFATQTHGVKALSVGTEAALACSHIHRLLADALDVLYVPH